MSMEDYNFEQARRYWNSEKPINKGEKYMNIQKEAEEYARRFHENQEKAQLQSPVETQMEHLQKSIAYLEAAIDTLTHRLRPVLHDAPETCLAQESIGASMSPVTAAFYVANQQVHRAATNVQDLIERLEV